MTGPLEQFTILIVDDEPLLREYLNLKFKQLGAITLQASSGAEAFAIVQTSPVSCVITDIRMANGNGFDLLNRMLDLPAPRPQAFIMTGDATVKPEELDRLGASAFFGKPLDMDRIVACVTQNLMKRGRELKRIAK